MERVVDPISFVSYYRLTYLPDVLFRDHVSGRFDGIKANPEVEGDV